MADRLGRLWAVVRRHPVRALAVTVVLVVGTVAVGAIASGDGDDEVTAAGMADTTSTTEDVEPTTTSSTTTTAAPTTTTTEAPTTTAPPAPPPTPSTTSPSDGRLDVPEVVSFAKAHQLGTPGPIMYSGTSCEATSDVIHDMGDDADGDLGNVVLARDCDATFRLYPMASDAAFFAYWVEIDSKGGGCSGVDAVALIWSEGGAKMRGAVVQVSTCEQGSWAVVDTARNPGAPNKMLDFRGSSFGDPASFRWRAGLLSTADDEPDMAPNTGFAAFQR